MDAPWLSYERDWFKVRRGVYRALRNDPITLRVLLEIEDRAAYVAGPRMDARGRVVDLDLGQALIGRGDLVKALRAGDQAVGAKTGAHQVSEENIKTSLRRLVHLGIIAVRATNRGTIVTLVGYSDSGSAGSVKPPTRPPAAPPTTRRPATTNEEWKDVPDRSSTIQDAADPEPDGDRDLVTAVDDIAPPTKQEWEAERARKDAARLAGYGYARRAARQ